jgi:hypothetical protein
MTWGTFASASPSRPAELGPALGSFDYNVVIPREKVLSFPYPKRLRLDLLKELRSELGLE